MTRKSFFKERSSKEIEALQLQTAFRANGLVKRILDLNPTEEAVEIRTPIIPGQFHQRTSNTAQASRKCYKHGELITSSQPKGQKQAISSREIPLQIRERDFSKLRGMREEEINYVGFSWYPVQGNDRRKRVVPFVWLPEGERLFAYGENQGTGIEIKSYANARRASKEGAEVICKVPSRTAKQPRYNLKLKHVPIISSPERKAAVWSLKSTYEDGEEPEHSTWNIKYGWDTSRTDSDVFTFYPHDIAAYIAIAGSELKENKNMTPLEMNPFAWPSKRLADFYNRLNNNVVIFDPTLSGKNKHRKLHVAEKSILIARSIGVLGHDATMYWDGTRDGAIKNYDWKIPK